MDEALIRKKLAFIETCLRELRELAQLELYETDVKERRFIEHTLQLCIQAIQDIASHIVSDQRLGEPEDNRALLTALAGGSWIPVATVPALRNAIAFRNVLVHGYTAVDPEIVRDVIENHLGDIESFVFEIRGRLAP